MVLTHQGPFSSTSEVFSRIPGATCEKLRDILRAGQIVLTTGHVEGIAQNASVDKRVGLRSVELVANRVHIEDMSKLYGAAPE